MSQCHFPTHRYGTNNAYNTPKTVSFCRNLGLASLRLWYLSTDQISISAHFYTELVPETTSCITAKKKQTEATKNLPLQISLYEKSQSCKVCFAKTVGKPLFAALQLNNQTNTWIQSKTLYYRAFWWVARQSRSRCLHKK